ncbi:hypothetical protein BCEP27_190005 [Burkholderia cepacia]
MRRVSREVRGMSTCFLHSWLRSWYRLPYRVRKEVKFVSIGGYAHLVKIAGTVYNDSRRLCVFYRVAKGYYLSVEWYLSDGF